MREPEPETIRLAQAGDLQAFESIVREQQADVWRFAYHLTRNRATAEDVTQEAFLRAFRAHRVRRPRWGCREPRRRGGPHPPMSVRHR